VLSEYQNELAVSELIRKCRIVQNGSLKRGKAEEAEYYNVIARRFEEPTSVSQAADGRSILPDKAISQ